MNSKQPDGQSEARMDPVGKWAVDALKLPTKVIAGLFLFSVLLLLFSALG